MISQWFPTKKGVSIICGAQFIQDEIRTTVVDLKLKKSEGSSLKGPSYCEKQRKLEFGEIRNTSVGVKDIRADLFRRMQALTIPQAIQAGLLETIPSDDFLSANNKLRVGAPLFQNDLGHSPISHKCSYHCGHNTPEHAWEPCVLGE